MLSWHGSHFWVCITFCRVRHGDSVTKPDYYYYYYYEILLIRYWSICPSVIQWIQYSGYVWASLNVTNCVGACTESTTELNLIFGFFKGGMFISCAPVMWSPTSLQTSMYFSPLASADEYVAWAELRLRYIHHCQNALLNESMKWNIDRWNISKSLLISFSVCYYIYIIFLFEISDKPHRFTKQQRDKN